MYNIIDIYIYINIHIEQYFHSSLINKRKNLPMAFFQPTCTMKGTLYMHVCVWGVYIDMVVPFG